jgi:hypothetical protein
MKRTFLAAALGIVALFGVSVTLVLFLTGNLSPSPPAAAAPETAPALETAPAPVAVAAPRTASRGDAGAARVLFGSSADEGSPVPTADRVTRKAVRRALLAPRVQSRLAQCVDREVGFGTAPGRAPRDRPATLVLELESVMHEVRIVEARVQSWGGASEESASCARKVLLGTVVAAATPAHAGRVRMPFTLHARQGILANR